MNRRGLIGTLFSLPLLRGAGGNEGNSMYSVAQFSPRQELLKGFVGNTIGCGTTHLLKTIDLKTGKLPTHLGLGVIIVSTSGIYEGDKTDAYL